MFQQFEALILQFESFYHSAIMALRVEFTYQSYLNRERISIIIDVTSYVCIVFHTFIVLLTFRQMGHLQHDSQSCRISLHMYPFYRIDLLGLSIPSTV